MRSVLLELGSLNSDGLIIALQSENEATFNYMIQRSLKIVFDKYTNRGIGDIAK